MIYTCIILVAAAINVVACVRMEKKHVDAIKAEEATEDALNRLAGLQQERIYELEKINARLIKIMITQKEEHER